ncbi:MAG: hypothetical protein FWD18_04990 [Micrococcales bacterium]|nr:hypothetical protein [Micrococcales bacterium]
MSEDGNHLLEQVAKTRTKAKDVYRRADPIARRLTEDAARATVPGWDQLPGWVRDQWVNTRATPTAHAIKGASLMILGACDLAEDIIPPSLGSQTALREVSTMVSDAESTGHAAAGTVVGDVGRLHKELFRADDNILPAMLGSGWSGDPVRDSYHDTISMEQHQLSPEKQFLQAIKKIPEAWADSLLQFNSDLSLFVGSIVVAMASLGVALATWYTVGVGTAALLTHLASAIVALGSAVKLMLDQMISIRTVITAAGTAIEEWVNPRNFGIEA